MPGAHVPGAQGFRPAMLAMPGAQGFRLASCRERKASALHHAGSARLPPCIMPGAQGFCPAFIISRAEALRSRHVRSRRAKKRLTRGRRSVMVLAVF